jgi:two-component system OmpR family sensor kinase
MRQLSRAAREVSPKSLGERFDVPTTDREVARLESELNSALERLEAGYKAQDQFIANVSHELRTPVAVLLTQAQVAKMGERSLEKGYAFVDRAEQLLKRLGKVVESFLVLARADIEQGLAGDTVSVIDIVLGCLQSCKDVAEQNRVRLIPRFVDPDAEGLELTIDGDAALLQTMLENLVRNAISHSPPDGEVALEAGRSESSLRLVVRDQGPGVPEEYRERIFERFVQVPEGSARRDGTGLGLAIANGIARLHGGSIGVENGAAAGCSFVVTLPAGRATARDAASQGARDAELGRDRG